MDVQSETSKKPPIYSKTNHQMIDILLNGFFRCVKIHFRFGGWQTWIPDLSLFVRMHVLILFVSLFVAMFVHLSFFFFRQICSFTSCAKLNNQSTAQFTNVIFSSCIPFQKDTIDRGLSRTRHILIRFDVLHMNKEEEEAERKRKYNGKKRFAKHINHRTGRGMRWIYKICAECTKPIVGDRQLNEKTCFLHFQISPMNEWNESMRAEREWFYEMNV